MELWIEVRGGLGPLWVREEECRLPDGSPAFANQRTPLPPLPAWFEAPPNSTVRVHEDMRDTGLPLIENRSMQGNAAQVLTFYEGVAKRAGLARTNWQPFGWPGFRAENTDYALIVEALDRKDLVFWTVQLGNLTGQRPTIISSGRYLLFAGRKEDRVTLRREAEGKEYWAPSGAFRDTAPPPVEVPPTEPILWSLLPAWVQFAVESGSHGELVRHRDETGAEKWGASIDWRFRGTPQAMFDSCLDGLDAHGFDATGAHRPDHSYYVSVCGVQWTAHVRSEEGDRAGVTVIDTLGHLNLVIRYTPVPSAPVPRLPAGAG